jgi:two-component system, OmpR family, sensor kinase
VKRFASLTSRLVVTAVALVALVSLLIGATTALAMHGYLTDRLDAEVGASLDRTLHRPPGEAVGDGDGEGDRDRYGDGGGADGDWDGDGRRGGLGIEVGTVLAVLPDTGDPEGTLISPGDEGLPFRSSLSGPALAGLADVPADGEAHSVDLPRLGHYRVRAEDLPDGSVVAGLPANDVDDTLASLVGLEALLGLLGVLAAAGIGTYVVRRQLRPLHEVASTAHSVAALPLAAGEIDLSERVPAHLTDERTEVGQVGAALNALLTHVESSLEARHRSEQQVRQFVADASHELRTPLATIAGYAELARRRPDDDLAVRTALGKVEEESGRMTTLVEDLLLLARLDSGRPLERKPVDLTRLLLEAVSDARVLAPDHRWRLELPEDGVEVCGDELRLHQVVTNLLTNARKYTPPGTTVTVRAHDGGFEVRDDGPGFPPDLAGHAFERFARGDVARTRGDGTDATPGGAGLGLALVHAIVTAHGGSVTLTTTPGDTTLAVTLPR